MRVGVDATSWENRRGFGRFARNAVGRLVAVDSDTTYVFVTGDASNGASFPEAAERLVVPLRRSSPRGPAAGSRRPLRDLARLARAASRNEFAAFLFPSHYSYFPVIGVPTVIGVHDTTARERPELLFESQFEHASWRMKELLAIRRADRLFTVSAASRGAIANLFGLPEDAVAIVPEAPDAVFSPKGAKERDLARASIGLGVREPFIVYAAGISPHKNIETLLEAAANLPERVRIVVAGDLDDGYLSAAGPVRARIAQLGLSSRAVLPGYLSDEVLAGLYSAATAAVVPSLSEGFGLPAVEAAACGCAVVLSDLPAHRETLAPAALFFEATDVVALTDGLMRLLQDEPFRRAVADRCRLAVAKLSWDASAARLRELVHEAAEASTRA